MASLILQHQRDSPVFVIYKQRHISLRMYQYQGGTLLEHWHFQGIKIKLLYEVCVRAPFSGRSRGGMPHSLSNSYHYSIKLNAIQGEC